MAFLSTKKSSLIIISLLATVLLLQFNNCSEKQSGLKDGESGSTSLSSNSPDDGSSSGSKNPVANVPVDPLNPYVLQCITSSDGRLIGSALAQSYNQAQYVKSVAGKLGVVDWSQDKDLILTLDNLCIKNSHYRDPVFNYLTAESIDQVHHQTVYVIKKEQIPRLKEFTDTILRSPCLIAADKNGQMRLSADASDPYFSSLAHLSAIGATESFLTSIQNYNDGQIYKTKVAVIDTGVDTANPDLIDNFARDGQGQIIGFNSTAVSTSNDFTDSGFHGTHVSGLIGAGFHNGFGVSGVHGRNVALYPVRASNDGNSMSYADVANGITWAADQGVDLINMSLGTDTDSSVVKNAISYAISKNVTIVVASGNDGKQLVSGSFTRYPAMYSTQFQGLITVGSIDASSKQLSSFSNYSSTYVDILSPGSNGSKGILSTVPVSLSGGRGIGAIITTSTGQQAPIQGTSMATPVVTGALAAGISIAKAKNFQFTNAQWESFLKMDGSPKSSAYSKYSFNGSYLNLPTFINFIKSKIETTEPPPSNDTLVITIQPASKQLVVAESTDLSVEVISNGTPTYQWYQNNTKIAGATAKKLSLSQVTTAQAGLYYVEISVGSKKLSSQKAEVKVALKYCD